MIFEWDEGKRNANLVRHGIDFPDAALLFDGRPVITVPSPFEDEERFLTVGVLDRRFMTAVWTWRGDAIRIISARRSRDDEKKRYHALFA